MALFQAPRGSPRGGVLSPVSISSRCHYKSSPESKKCLGPLRHKTQGGGCLHRPRGSLRLVPGVGTAFYSLLTNIYGRGRAKGMEAGVRLKARYALPAAAFSIERRAFPVLAPNPFASPHREHVGGSPTRPLALRSTSVSLGAASAPQQLSVT